MSYRVRIKFCGITRLEDAQAAVALGVDAIGFVLTQRSKRFVKLEQAAAIRAALPPFVDAVALVMDDSIQWVADVSEALQPDLLQFHGDEAAAQCERHGRRYLKAVPMGSVTDVPGFAARHPHAAGFLLDSHAQGAMGGSGERFDWRRVPKNVGRPLVLAGGLDADNVVDAILTARPYAVDVSSGIESAPGIKDAERMRRFVAAVRAAERAIPG
jgi:phosphoribosylanthranilate isomerase